MICLKRQYNHKRRSLITNSGDNFTPEDIKQMLIDQDGKCAYCEVDITYKYHIDHMTPLVREGSNGWHNIALTCPGCNTTKNSKTAEEFMVVIQN